MYIVVTLNILSTSPLTHCASFLHSLKFLLLLAGMLLIGTVSSQAQTRYFPSGTAPETMDIGGMEISSLNGTFRLVDYGEDQINADIYELDGDPATTIQIYEDGSWWLGHDGSPSGMPEHVRFIGRLLVI